MKFVRISIRGDFHRISVVHIRQIALIDVHQNPYGAHVGDREALRRSRLKQLAGADQPFGDFAAHRSKHRNL